MMNLEEERNDPMDWATSCATAVSPHATTLPPKNSRFPQTSLSGFQPHAKESQDRSQKRIPYISTFRAEEKTKIVENFSEPLEGNRLHEALGFFESRRRVPPVIYEKSSVLINVRSGDELIPMELEAFSSELETELNKLSSGDPVQFFFIHRRSANQLVFARLLERDDPVCELHKMSLAASGPLFPLRISF